jgi:hypothetical protein
MRTAIIGRLFAVLIAIFCALTGPDDETVYVQPNDVVSIRPHGERFGGGAPTVVITTNGTLYVKESVETVVAKLRGAIEAVKPIGDDK